MNFAVICRALEKREDLENNAASLYNMCRCTRQCEEIEEAYHLFQTYTVAQMRDAEQRSITCGVPLAQLMDNAGRALARCAISMNPDPPVAVVCGVGNNGGDGYVCAAALRRHGVETQVWGIHRDKLADDSLAGAAAKAYEGAGGVIRPLTEGTEALSPCAFLIDAVFGTGLRRPVSGVYAHAIRLIGLSGARVLSCDVPSGIDADTGRVMGDAVHADVTLMLGLAKPACYLPPGCECFGDARLADIGIPEEAKP